MDLNEYYSAITNLTKSDAFAALDDSQKQLAFMQYRDEFLAGNPDANPDEVNAVTETANKTWLRNTGRGRAIPLEFLQKNQILFPNQEEGYNELTQDEKRQKLEEFQLRIPEIASMNPTQREDTEYYLNQATRELTRQANGEGKGRVRSYGASMMEGFFATLADGVGATDTSQSIRDWFQENPEYDEEFISQLSNGAGSALASVLVIAGTAAATRGLGGSAAAARNAGTLASFGTNSVMRFNEAYQNAIDAGLDENRASHAGISALPGAVVDTIGDKIIAEKFLPDEVNAIFKTGTQTAKKEMLSQLIQNNTFRSKLVGYAASALGEGVSEMAGDYLAAYGPYLTEGVDKRPSDKESLNSFLIGAILGGGIPAAVDIPEYIGNRKGETEVSKTQTGELSVAPKYSTKSEMRLGETERVLTKLPSASTQPVYDLLANGDYKGALDLSRSMLKESTKEESPVDFQEAPMDNFPTIDVESEAVDIPEIETVEENKIINPPVESKPLFEPTLAQTEFESSEQAVEAISQTVRSMPDGDYEWNTDNGMVPIVKQGNQFTYQTTGQPAPVFRVEPVNADQEVPSYKIQPPAELKQVAPPKPPEVKTQEAKAPKATPPKQPDFKATYKAILDTGTVPASNQNTSISKMWEWSKNTFGDTADTRQKFVQAATSVKANTREAWREALDQSFKKPESQTLQQARKLSKQNRERVRQAFGVQMPAEEEESINIQDLIEQTRIANKGGVSAEVFLEDYKNRFKAGRRIAMVNQMLADLQASNPNVRFIISNELPFRGAFDNSNNIIYLKDLSLRTVAHEIAHALTDASVILHVNNRAEKDYRSKLNGALKDYSTPAPLRAIIKAYLHAAKQLGFEDQIGQDDMTSLLMNKSVDYTAYSFRNLNEFIAETFANSEFQEKLADIPFNGKTVWRTIVEAIQDALAWIKTMGEPSLVLRNEGANTYVATMTGIRSIMSEQAEDRKNNINLLPLDHRTDQATEDALADSNFFRFAKVLIQHDGQSFRSFGKTQVASDGVMNENRFLSVTQIPKQIFELAKQVYPEAWEGENINVNQLLELEKARPLFETHVYGQDGTDAIKAERDQLMHEWYDNLGSAVRNHVEDYRYALDEESALNLGESPQTLRRILENSGVDLQKLDRWVELNAKLKDQPDVRGPRATSFYDQISPFDTTKYPVVRIDVTVPQNRISAEANELSKKEKLGTLSARDMRRLEEIQSNSDILPTLWTQDDLHENLPNTLGWAMVQFVPDPNTGETVMFVAEQQSRWGQAREKYSIKQNGDEFDVWYKPTEKPAYVDRSGFADKETAQKHIDAKVPPHELLDHQHKLVLKAAMDEARKRGVTKMVVSDGETAMMTEGHDTTEKIGEKLPATPKNVNKAKEILNSEYAVSRLSNQEKVMLQDIVAGRDVSISQSQWYNIQQLRNEKLDFQYARPSQEKGMRQHYDSVLQAAAEKMTRSKGRAVDMGVHKNQEIGTKSFHSRGSRYYNTRAEAELDKKALDEIMVDGLEMSSRIIEMLNGEFRLEYTQFDTSKENKPLGSPVFRNPDGAPKATATGKMYDLTNKNNISFLPESLDDAYLAAVEAGDMETAQRMVDEAAMATGYKTNGFHGTNAPEFTKFQPSRIFGDSWFFSDTPDYPAERGNRVLNVYLNVGRQKIVKIPTTKPWGVPSYEIGIIEKARHEGYNSVRLEAIPPAWMRALLPLIGLKAEVSGYTNATVVFSPEQIKSADPVTYDISGKPIPLSRRFNPQKNNINYLPEQLTNKERAAKFKKLAAIKAGKLNDKFDYRTQKIIELMQSIKADEVHLLDDELRGHLFRLIDNVYESRKNAVPNPQVRYDSDEVIGLLEVMKEAIDSAIVEQMVGEYDGLIDFDQLGIDLTNKEAVKEAINDYVEKGGFEQAILKSMKDARAKDRLNNVQQKWRTKYQQIKGEIINRFADADNFLSEYESLHGGSVSSDPENINVQLLKYHFNHLINTDPSQLEGTELYNHFFAINNLLDWNIGYLGKVTAKALAKERDANQNIQEFAGNFRNPYLRGRFLKGLDKANETAELHQTRLQRLSAFDKVHQFLQEDLMGPVYDGVIRVAQNLKMQLLEEYEQERNRLFGGELNTEDRASISIMSRLAQFETGTDPDQALKNNIKKERKSIENALNRHDDQAERDLFRYRVKPLFESIVEGLEEYGPGAMQYFMDTFDARVGGEAGPERGALRRELLNKQQEIFSRFTVSSRIISEGFHGQPFHQYSMYIPNDVKKFGTAKENPNWKMEDSLDDIEIVQRQSGMTTEPSHMKNRTLDLGEDDYYSYNNESSLQNNITRLAVHQSTIAERSILAHRIRKGSSLHNIISQDENGVNYPERISYIEELVYKLINNAVSRGAPLNPAAQLLRSATGVFARATLTSVHHVVTQPIAACADYVGRTGNLSGWIEAAAFYASNRDRVNQWFHDNQRWTAERTALEAMSLDPRRLPEDDTETKLRNHPYVKTLEKIYKGAGDVLTTSLRMGDNFASRVTVLAEYARLLKKKGYKFDSIDEVPMGQVEGRILTQATLNAERNVNTSNKILRGELFVDRNTPMTLLRNLLFAFSAHSSSLATQMNQAMRDTQELVGLDAPREEVFSKLRTMGSIAMQQVVFTGTRYAIGAALASAMIAMIRDMYDDRDGKIEELQLKLDRARMRGDKVEIALAEKELANAKTVRGIVEKFRHTATTPDSLLKQTIRDGSGAFHIAMNNNGIQQAFFMISGVDPLWESISKATQDNIEKDLQTQLTKAKEKGNLKKAAKLTEQLATVGAWEYIPIVYNNTTGYDVGGLYGATLDSYGKSVKEIQGAIFGAKEFSLNDWLLMSATAGVGQAEVTKFMNHVDRIQDEVWKREQDFQETKLPKAREEKRKAQFR